MPKLARDNKNNESLESERKEEFLKAFRKLVEKYGYDFDMSISVAKVEVKKNEKIINVHK